ncbi:hypothetical protein C8R45DRAFT_1204258, partial [Mycena sanguinolenta]
MAQCVGLCPVGKAAAAPYVFVLAVYASTCGRPALNTLPSWSAPAATLPSHPSFAINIRPPSPAFTAAILSACFPTPALAMPLACLESTALARSLALWPFCSFAAAIVL